MRKIAICRSCKSSDFRFILDLGRLHLSSFVNEGETTPRYPLTLVLCTQCKLVQLLHTVPAEEMYLHYWYRSGTNRSMTLELKNIVDSALTHLGRAPSIVLDIGCNDGTLLRAYDSSIYTVGFEPASNLLQYISDSVDVVINDFFNYTSWYRQLGTKHADIITSIAMFYDLDDPNTFVEDVKSILSDDGLWIIQLTDLKSMLECNMWDDICHEHLEYFSLMSLEYLLNSHGFVVEDIEHNDVNGGSIRVFVRKTGYSSSTNVVRFRKQELAYHLESIDTYQSFSERVISQTELLKNFVKQIKRDGKSVYVYGASTKGNTLLQYSGLDFISITAAAERNPDKWGKFTVGTNIPIISEEEARAAHPDYFLVLPWHFMDEFIERESSFLDSGGKFIVPLPNFRIFPE